MKLIEAIQKYGLEYLGRFYSVYRGIVEDPDCNDGTHDGMGYLKVYLPTIHDGMRVWARPKALIGGLISGAKYLIPKRGDTVFVEFEGGDPYKALWSYHNWNIGEVPDELKSREVAGIVTPKGHSIVLDEENDTLDIKLVEGSSVHIEKEKMSIANKDEDSKVTIDGTNIKIENSKGLSIEITDNKIIINGGNNKEVVNIDPLKQVLNQIIADIKTIAGAMKSIPVAVTPTGSMTASTIVEPTASVPQNLGDTKLTH